MLCIGAATAWYARSKTDFRLPHAQGLASSEPSRGHDGDAVLQGKAAQRANIHGSVRRLVAACTQAQQANILHLFPSRELHSNDQGMCTASRGVRPGQDCVGQLKAAAPARNTNHQLHQDVHQPDSWAEDAPDIINHCVRREAV
eukprot:1158768-Pelagomonas_calceolata.AAC.5